MAFLNDITLGQFYPGNSFLHRLDPRSKLFASLILMSTLLLSHEIGLTLVFCGICITGIGFSGIPYYKVLGNLKVFFWLFLITFLIHVFTTPGNPLVTLPLLGIVFSEEGVINGLVYSIRLALLVVFAGLLTMTTSPMELTDGLEKLFSPLKRFKVPVHEFVLMMTLSLRFLPILILEAQRIKNAQLSRGVSLAGGLLSKVRNIIPMILPLFVSAFRRAEDLAVAMEARNYRGGDGRTSFRRLEFAGRDFVLLIFAIGTLTGTLILT